MTPRVRSLQGFHVAFVWLCAAIAGFPASVGCTRAAPTGAALPVALRASASDGVAGITRIAETANGGSWSLRGQRLEFADNFGEITADIDLGERGYGVGLRLAVDPYDQSAWLGTDIRLLLNFSTSGALLAGNSLTGDVDALAIALDQTPWVVSEGAVLHLSRSASVLETYATFAGTDVPVTGFVVDLKWLKDAIEHEVLWEFDHRHLNLEVREFADNKLIPTTENIAIAAWKRLEPAVSQAGGARLRRVRVYKTPEIFAEYRGEK